MLAGFETRRIKTSGAEIHVAVAGEGPGLLLLHGYPETHLMWHRMAGALAEHFTVVAADLRGYGESGKPASDPAHATYSKRAMAQDQVEVMEALGFTRFAVVGHDRGARVGHRMALDHPDRLTRLALLDIAPTLTMFRTADETLARAYYHWFFLSQPYDLPERLIGGDPEFFLRWCLNAWSKVPDSFAEEIVADYVRCFRASEAIHATCEDYRAASTIDLEHDEADAGRRIECPVHLVWGAQGVIGRTYDVLAVWREKAREVTGDSVPCGHFLPEEAPQETLAALQPFLYRDL